ncbi:MAG: COQ9 family protein [Micavibrio sp.]|nr:MAG: COQ9 family protein [Micavibrio sp.]
MKKKQKSDRAETRDRALLQLLPRFGFEGWSDTVLRRAAAEDGEGDSPDGAGFADALEAALYFSSWADRRMAEKIAAMPEFSKIKVREKIFTGVKTRLDVLMPHKQAVKNSVRFMAHPLRAPHVPRMIWATADEIWHLAGDTATDYNHYSKRMLLSGVMGTTTAFWLRDESDNFAATQDFLQRRIENVLHFGRVTAKVKKAGKSVFCRKKSAAE